MVGSLFKGIFSKKILAAVLLVLAGVHLAGAQSLKEARTLIQEEDWGGARNILEIYFDNTPASSRTGEANYLMGLCEFADADYEAAEPLFRTALSRGVPLANLYLGRIAFLDYRFDDAAAAYDAYASTAAGKKDMATVGRLRKQLEIAENSLSNVENILIIDRLQVPSYELLKAIRLPYSAGRLLPSDSIPDITGRENATMAFENEKGDFMLWTEPDAEGLFHLVEAEKLTDGTWTKKTCRLPEDNASDMDFPFMRPDGTTLYFASDNEDSMGGLDLFVATRDPQTDGYLKPRNLGMPFNSPYDDYMLAIDEVNGIGWWASDRENLGDRVTVYIFRLPDLRRNHDAEDENILEYARLRTPELFPDPDGVREDFKKVIASIDPNKKGEDLKEFSFFLPGGRVYHSLGDFRTGNGRKYGQDYLIAQKELEDTLGKLAELRVKFSKSRNSSSASVTGERILEYEKHVADLRKRIIWLRGKAIQAETSAKR